jgi:hypothetical protein
MAKLTPRQVAVRGQEMAAQLVSALHREGLVTRFLNSYAKDAKRPGRTANPERYRELSDAIRREALLVLVLEVESEIPGRLGTTARRRLTPAQSELAALFHKELFYSLGRSLKWDEREFDAFCRDLGLYRKLYANSPRSPKIRNARTSPSGPFVDRCGILLDPAMLDLARQAAAKFEAELVTAASAKLRKVFSRSEGR